MFLFCLVFAMSLCASVYMCFVVTCWERADLLALVCCVYCEFVTFPIGILGQVWYLIVSIPDFCTLTYFLLLIFYVFSVLCLLCLCARLFICALWSPAGKGLTSWLSFMVSDC